MIFSEVPYSMEKQMATHSSILAGKSMDREDCWATAWGHKESDMTERLTILLSRFTPTKVPCSSEQVCTAATIDQHAPKKFRCLRKAGEGRIKGFRPRKIYMLRPTQPAAQQTWPSLQPPWPSCPVIDDSLMAT